jgi:hypothetical protein
MTGMVRVEVRLIFLFGKPDGRGVTQTAAAQ